MKARAWTLAAAAVVLPVQMAMAQTSAGCDLLQTSAQEGMSLRVAADDDQIPMPQSVRNLTCMNFFFNGTLFNVLTDWRGALVGMLTQAAFQAVCGLAQSAWDSTLGRVQCGITLAGINLGFGGSLGGGSFCPNIVIGGGGPRLASASLGAGARNAAYFGHGMPVGPTGYPMGIPFNRSANW